VDANLNRVGLSVLRKWSGICRISSLSWRNSTMVAGPLSHHSTIEYVEIFGAATVVALLADLLVAYVHKIFEDRHR
jgi:hypothetical protein